MFENLLRPGQIGNMQVKQCPPKVQYVMDAYITLTLRRVVVILNSA